MKAFLSFTVASLLAVSLSGCVAAALGVGAAAGAGGYYAHQHYKIVKKDQAAAASDAKASDAKPKGAKTAP